jgi:DNA-binding LacI/PurR family transcriptional regulator
MVLGRKLQWDPAKEEFVNDDVANRLRTRAMRSPWSLALCEQLQISRSTLRRALAQLQAGGLIASEHGAGNRIVRPARPAGTRASRLGVAVLTPEPLEALRPSQALWIDELRALLGERGCPLHVVQGRQYFRANPAAALARLVRQQPHGCWVLTLAGAGCQRWFAQHGVPCVVAGSCHAGIDLPFRDIDHRATCRHAAGILLGLGHRRLAFVAAATGLAGDLESEAGFFEGVRGSPQTQASAVVCRHGGTPAGIAGALQRLGSGRTAPTGLLVVNAHHGLAVISGLAALGRRVPAEISVISRDDDSFLSYLVPSPARYVTSPRAFARSLLPPVLALLAGGTVSQRVLRLMPEFIAGASVAPAPRPAE